MNDVTMIAAGSYRTIHVNGQDYLLTQTTFNGNIAVAHMAYDADGRATLTPIDSWWTFADAEIGAAFHAARLTEQRLLDIEALLS